MKVYVVTNKESQIVGYGENLKNLVEKLDLEDHHIYSLNLGKNDKISNGKMYPVMVQIENGEASMEVYEGVESPVFISEPMVYIEFITTNKFMVCVSTIFTFEEDYEIIRALVKYILKFVATAKESLTVESDVNELVSVMNDSYPTIPGLGFPMNSSNYNEHEKNLKYNEEDIE